eukprot:COSAG01_NODE_31_length_35900_cov_44.332169_18_plen_102_part_00
MCGQNELTCHDWDWFFILLLMFSQLVGGFGASLAMVGSTTFMLLCHPKARSSISSSQRLGTSWVHLHSAHQKFKYITARRLCTHVTLCADLLMCVPMLLFN